ncbi:Dyp-type peroxidase [Marinomonas sp. C2222]|uniref:Dyp-type peroxidase n=1 Tax=Marinomonas sargassi TaxID=2984494 RepID=A0ABT2YQK5_9GAMM|nr:Dyp-type peroxidase [Marinomonas sargassi]MCV2402177.1 Dyp-type peroxidase [Marinomonas sargassi]
MTNFQSGVIAEASSDALFLTFNVKNQNFKSVKATLVMAPTFTAELQEKYPNADLHMAVGISHQAWQNFDISQPKELAPFPHIKGQDAEAVSTDVDLVLHIRSLRRDVTYLLATKLHSSLGDSVALVEEVSCFQYLDSRDLTGFVDGTENPAGESRKEVALVKEDEAFKNGSYLNLMKFVHNLPKWEKEEVKTQEDIYGRTKEDNIEYAGADKSLHSHTKRTSLKDEHGKSLEILRQSMPFASLHEKGLMFASYSKSPMPFNRMLESMLLGDEHGHTDHLMKYTSIKTGQAFFVPSIDWLKSLA